MKETITYGNYRKGSVCTECGYAHGFEPSEVCPKCGDVDKMEPCVVRLVIKKPFMGWRTAWWEVLKK